MAYTAQKYHLRLFSDGLREYHLRWKQGLMINDHPQQVQPMYWTTD